MTIALLVLWLLHTGIIALHSMMNKDQSKINRNLIHTHRRHDEIFAAIDAELTTLNTRTQRLENHYHK